jgi:hypothetical protein
MPKGTEWLVRSKEDTTALVLEKTFGTKQEAEKHAAKLRRNGNRDIEVIHLMLGLGEGDA